MGALAGPALAQTLGRQAGVEIHWWRVIGALIVCIGLAVGAAFALRHRLQLGAAPRLFGAGPRLFGAPLPRRLQLVESLRLTHQVDVCLVRCDNQDYLLAVSPGGIVSVTNGPLPPLAEATP
jgi:flagellar biogenesis protein FliO